MIGLLVGLLFGMAQDIYNKKKINKYYINQYNKMIDKRKMIDKK
jgi:hypothetical protein